MRLVIIVIACPPDAEIISPWYKWIIWFIDEGRERLVNTIILQYKRSALWPYCQTVEIIDGGLELNLLGYASNCVACENWHRHTHNPGRENNWSTSECWSLYAYYLLRAVLVRARGWQVAAENARFAKRSGFPFQHKTIVQNLFPPLRDGGVPKRRYLRNSVGHAEGKLQQIGSEIPISGRWWSAPRDKIDKLKGLMSQQSQHGSFNEELVYAGGISAAWHDVYHATWIAVRIMRWAPTLSSELFMTRPDRYNEHANEITMPRIRIIVKCDWGAAAEPDSTSGFPEARLRLKLFVENVTFSLEWNVSVPNWTMPRKLASDIFLLCQR